MKGNLSRILKTGVAMLLVICMMAGSLPAVFAGVYNSPHATSETISYVSLGDSIASGYGLSGFGNNGYLNDTASAYPVVLAKKLSAHLKKNVDLTNLALSTMRAEDLNLLLSLSADDAKKIDEMLTWDQSVWDSITSKGDKYTYDEFSGRIPSFEEAATKYQEAVKNADLITLGIGNDDFNVFMFDAFMNALGYDGEISNNSWIDLEAKLDMMDADTKNLLLSVYESLLDLLSSKLPLDETVSKSVADAMVYALASYVISYGEIIDKISELNPDAKVIIVGLENSLSGFDLDLKLGSIDKTVDLGRLFGLVIDAANLYLAGVPAYLKASGNSAYDEVSFYFAALPEAEMIADLLPELDLGGWTETVIVDAAAVRAGILDTFNGAITTLIKAMANNAIDTYGLSLTDITASDLEEYLEYEKNLADHLADPSLYAEPVTALSNNTIISCAIYLAFEHAIVDGSENTLFSLESIKSIASDISSVFSGVAGSVDIESLVSIDTIYDKVCNAIKNDDTAVENIKNYVKSVYGDDIEADLTAWYADYCTANSLVPDTARDEDLILDKEFELLLTYLSKDDVKEYIINTPNAGGKYVVDYSVRFAAPALTEALENAIEGDTNVFALFSVFSRFLIGDALGIHPTANGHMAIADAIFAVYENEYTVRESLKDGTIDLIIELIALIKNNAPANLTDSFDFASVLKNTRDTEKAFAELSALLKGIDTDAIKAYSDSTSIDSAIDELAAVVNEYKAAVKTVKNTCEDFTYALLSLTTKDASEARESAVKARDEIFAGIDTLTSLAEELKLAANAVVTAAESSSSTELKNAVTNAAAIAAEAADLADEKALAELAYSEVYDGSFTSNHKYTNILAIGGEELALGTSFAELLTEKLGLANTPDALTKKAITDLRAEDLRYILDSSFTPDQITLAKYDMTALDSLRAELTMGITDAELIALSLDTTYISKKALTDAYAKYNGESITAPDWSRYLGSDADSIVNKVKSLANEYLTSLGYTAEKTELAMTALEVYAYEYVSYLVNASASAELIRGINPDAKIVIVGYENPLSVLDVLSGSLPLGTILDGATEVANLSLAAFSLFNENTLYFGAKDFNTLLDEDIANGVYNSETLVSFILKLAENGCASLYASTDGHQTIADTLYSALTVTDEHEYDSAWSSDDTGHWHECPCGDTTDFEAHTYTWIIDTDATEFTAGVMHEECVVCGYESGNTEEIPATHEHSYYSKWNVNETHHWNECACGAAQVVQEHTFEWVTEKEATEFEDGFMYEHCSVCEYKSGNTKIIPATHEHTFEGDYKCDETGHWLECACGEKGEVTEHTYEWVIDTEATEFEKGSKHEECTVCGYANGNVEEIPATHEHSFPADYTSDETGHWHECACGEKDGFEEHTFEWVTDKEATEFETGSRHEECTVCGYANGNTEELPATHEHSFEGEYKYNETEHWLECACGEKDTASEHSFVWVTDTEATETVTGSAHEECFVCGYESGEVKEIPVTHVHSFDGKWTTDGTNHWHECACGEKTDVAAHNIIFVVDKVATEFENGSKHEECTVCGYKTGKTEEIPATHTHLYSTVWSTDETSHWHECSCGNKIDSAEHTLEWVITTEATEFTKGEKVKVCKICSYVSDTKEEIPATHVHNFPLTYTCDANGHWYECACGEKSNYAEHTLTMVTDKEGSELTAGSKHEECSVCKYKTGKTEVIAPTHEHVANKDELSFTTNGTHHWKECSCGEKYDVQAHDIEWIIDKEATTTEKGQKHAKCKVCGYEAEAIEIEMLEDLTPPVEDNSLSKTALLWLWITLPIAIIAAVVAIVFILKKKVI